MNVFIRCGDPLGPRREPETTCTLAKAHKGLHTDGEREWAGNVEQDPWPASNFEIIQEGDRNSAMTLVAGEPHRLPSINYKSGWSFYWFETYDTVELLCTVMVPEHGKLLRKHLRKSIAKVWIDQAYIDIVKTFIQSFITEFELTLMKDMAEIDGKPLWQKEKLGVS